MSRTYVPIGIVRLVTDRARGQCEYCRCLSDYASDPFSIDHVIPEAMGGSSQEANLALSCGGCNNAKSMFVSGPDPVTGTASTLFNPRRERWADHFAWSDDVLSIVGLTATGRVTVEKLKLNRPGLRNLRRALRSVGVHPPD